MDIEHRNKTQAHTHICTLLPIVILGIQFLSKRLLLPCKQQSQLIISYAHQLIRTRHMHHSNNTMITKRTKEVPRGDSHPLIVLGYE